MKNNTITTIEKLQPGDIFKKELTGPNYTVISREKIIKNKKIFSGTCKRENQQRTILIHANIQVILISRK